MFFSSLFICCLSLNASWKKIRGLKAFVYMIFFFLHFRFAHLFSIWLRFGFFVFILAPRRINRIKIIAPVKYAKPHICKWIFVAFQLESFAFHHMMVDMILEQYHHQLFCFSTLLSKIKMQNLVLWKKSNIFFEW